MGFWAGRRVAQYQKNCKRQSLPDKVLPEFRDKESMEPVAQALLMSSERPAAAAPLLPARLGVRALQMSTVLAVNPTTFVQDNRDSPFLPALNPAA